MLSPIKLQHTLPPAVMEKDSLDIEELFRVHYGSASTTRGSFAGVTWPGFAAPISYPGPVLNQLEVQQVRKVALHLTFCILLVFYFSNCWLFDKYHSINVCRTQDLTEGHPLPVGPCNYHNYSDDL